jgi:hypothetical protein
VFLGATTYSFAVDAWSVGCVIGEILSCSRLFGLPTMKHDDEILQRIFHKLGNSCSEGIPGELMKLPAWSRHKKMLTEAQCRVSVLVSIVHTDPPSHGNADMRPRGSGSHG